MFCQLFRDDTTKAVRYTAFAIVLRRFLWKSYWKNWRPFGSIFDITAKTRRLRELDFELSSPELWNEPERARKVTQEASGVRRIVETFDRLWSDAVGLSEMLEIASNEEKEELMSEKASLETQVEALYKETLFTMTHADAPAIVQIKSGAGGTESQDWAAMLLRMYERWAERNGFKFELLDIQPGPQAGIANAEFIIRGERAFGMMSPEHGVHRLVRVSPFDNNSRRHTSFASIDVVPEVPEEEIDIHIPDSDVRVDVYRSQGAGGQGVNTTDSAVRVTHLPTGLIVAIQVTRSQIKNREMAFQILKQRLYDVERKKREEEAAKARGEQKKIEWGSQIRSYVLDKQYIKDHRSGLMRFDPDNVLEGDLDELMWAGLEWLAGKRIADATDSDDS